METGSEIVIWDSVPERIAIIDENLHRAMRRVGIRCAVSSMSEPPLLARMDMLGRLPSLEINGDYWTLEPGRVITEEECIHLLQFLKDRKA